MWTVGGWPLSSRWKRFAGNVLEVVLVFATLVLGWLVWWVIAWKRGQTPAKSLLGMRCVRTDTGVAATRGQMAVRELVGKIVLGNASCGLTDLISSLMILFGWARQGLWDKLSSTVVVDDRDGWFLPPHLR